MKTFVTILIPHNMYPQILSICFLVYSGVLAARASVGERDRCYGVGPSCLSRQIVAFCVKTPTGYEQIETETCNPGFHCSYATKKCVAATFKCHQPGVFPDPYDCHQYYRCAENSSNVSVYDAEIEYCVRYYHFDVLTGKCELHTTPGECEDGPQAVPDCREFVQTGALEANNNYYYVCARSATGELYPKIYKCGEGQYYDANRKECIQEI